MGILANRFDPSGDCSSTQANPIVLIAEIRDESTVTELKRNNLRRARIGIFLGTMLLGLNFLVDAAEARLSLELVDPGLDMSIAGWLRVLDSERKPIELPELYSRGIGLRQNHPGRRWYAIQGKTVLQLPKGEVYLEAFSGINSELSRRKLDLRFFERLSIKLPVRELLPLKQEGWRAGNTHLHLKGLNREAANRYLRTIPLSDRLDLLFVSYLERFEDDRSYISNEFSRGELSDLSSERLLMGNGQEHRHNFGSWGEGYGHVMFLDLPQLVRPVSVGKGITGSGFDSPALSKGIESARGQGATILWCHNGLGSEDAPNWLAGRIHAQNIFDGGSKGDYSETFYNYLNLGLSVPFSTGTDWFIYDFSRVYAAVKGQNSVESWLAALKAGRSFISNGPLLRLQVEESEIGGRLDLDRERSVGIAARAVGRGDFGSLEIIKNGQVVDRAVAKAVGNRFEALIKSEHVIGEASWIASRVSGGGLEMDGNVVVPPSTPIRGTSHGVNEMGEALFAHTSPIYLDFKGQRRFDVSVAEELIAELEIGRDRVLEKGLFQTTDERDQILSGYSESIANLRGKIKRISSTRTTEP